VALLFKGRGSSSRLAVKEGALCSSLSLAGEGQVRGVQNGMSEGKYFNNRIFSICDLSVTFHMLISWHS